MKYFFDTEFKEGFRKPLFGKRSHYIDLISIGIVAEDGREYYAISNEFDLRAIWFDSDTWVKDNVLKPIHEELCAGQNAYTKTYYYNLFEPFTLKSLKNLIKWHGKSIKKIADEIFIFINPHLAKPNSYDPKAGIIKYDDHRLHVIDYNNKHDIYEYAPDKKGPYFTWRSKPEFYAYYADYDWVVFCSLFGRMIDLPNGFPMYCKDLKQIMDSHVKNVWWPTYLKSKNGTFESRPKTFDQALKLYKNLLYFPHQTKEHNALADAKWNFELYKFLTDAAK